MAEKAFLEQNDNLNENKDQDQDQDQDQEQDHDQDQEIPEMDDNELRVFKENVKQWVRHDDDIRKIMKESKELNKKIKERKKERDEFNTAILSFMGKYKIGDLNTSNGRIKYSVSVKKSSLNLKGLEGKLKDYYKNDEESEKLLKYLKDTQEKKEKVSLRRTGVQAKSFNL